jgi:hypothetical protein
MDKREVEEYVGQEKDTAGYVQVIIDRWFLFQDLFSDWENKKKV